MARAQLVKLSLKHKGGVPDRGGGGVQTGKKGRPREGFLEEVMLELNPKPGGGVSPKGRHSGRGPNVPKRGGVTA